MTESVEMTRGMTPVRDLAGEAELPAAPGAAPPNDSAAYSSGNSAKAFFAAEYQSIALFGSIRIT